MNINHILICLRDSLKSIKVIKDAVNGHIYSSWINNETKFPGINMMHMSGRSPATSIKDAASTMVQLRICTINQVDYSRELYGIYSDITDNFHQQDYEDDNVKIRVTLGVDGTEYPAIMQENYKDNTVYSLPILAFCKVLSIAV